MGDRELVDREGNVYREGFLGTYHRAGEGLFGTASGSPKEGLFRPAEARGPLGMQVKAADGTPLYQKSDLGEKAAGGVALVVVAAVIAGVTLLFTLITQWYVPTLVGSVRRDVAARWLSLTTVGYGLGVITLLFVIAGSGTSSTAWPVVPMAFVVVAWVPMRLGRALRNYEKGRGGWALVGWLVSSVVIGWMVVAVALRPYSFTGFDAMLWLILVGGLAACLVGGLVWGLAGEPDLIRPRITRT